MKPSRTSMFKAV